MMDSVSAAKVGVAIGRSVEPDVVTSVHLRRGRELWTLARRLGLSEAEADDAVQEAMTRLWQALRSGSGITDPDAWAFRLVYRLAMDEHRLRRRLLGIASRLRGTRPVTPSDATTHLAVWAEVDRLPERQRAVLYLRYRSDLAFDQIATALGISSSAARSYATTGVARIRDALADARGADQ